MKKALLLAALLVTGCAWGPGTGFATLSGGRLDAALDLPAGRRDGPMGWKTNNGYVVTPEGGLLVIRLAGVALQTSAVQAAGVKPVFDPAKPPVGYSLCHGGHCHRADGALIDYAEVEAGLTAGGASVAATALSLKVGGAAPLGVPLGGRAGFDLAACEPGCAIPRGRLTALRLTATSLEAAGMTAAAAGGTLSAPVRWTLTLPLEGYAPEARIDVAAERDQPARFFLTGELKLSDRFFDGLDWDRLAQAPQPIALEADAASREQLLTNMAQSAWTARLDPQI